MQSGGRGVSIWDTFCRVPGAVDGGSDAATSRATTTTAGEEDLDLLASPRRPARTGSRSPGRACCRTAAASRTRPGLAFYRDLCDGPPRARDPSRSPRSTTGTCRRRSQDAGGWGSRDAVDALRRLRRPRLRRARRRSSSDWVTINEPWVVAFRGYAFGTKAPGRRDWPEALARRPPRCSWRTPARWSASAHGAARGADRARRSTSTRCTRDSDDPADRDAARRLDGFHNRWFLDPVFRGAYPADMVAEYERRHGPFDAVRPGDLEAIAAPVRLPRRQLLQARLGAREPGERLLRPRRRSIRRGEVTAMGWEVVPDALYDVLRRVAGELHGDPDPDHGERRRVRRRPQRRRRRRGPAARRLPEPPHRRDRARDRGRRAGAPATSPGRCSTTSSGSTATRSASGSSTSTTRPRSGSRRRARSGTATTSSAPRTDGGA